jgi:hypothetical protein
MLQTEPTCGEFSDLFKQTESEAKLQRNVRNIIYKQSLWQIAQNFASYLDEYMQESALEKRSVELQKRL